MKTTLPGLSLEDDAELEALRTRLGELATTSSPAEAAAADELRLAHKRVGELLEKAHARLQLRVDWDPRRGGVRGQDPDLSLG